MKDRRSHAIEKTFNYVYSHNPKRLVEILNLSKEEAERLREDFLSNFPGVKEFSKKVKEENK